MRRLKFDSSNSSKPPGSDGLRTKPVNAQAIHEQLCQAPVQHLDETGMRVAGKLHWLHMTSGEYAAYYRVEKKRGMLNRKQ